jgi:acetyltransferase-like isoleucine patch superfamily enzyme
MNINIEMLGVFDRLNRNSLIDILDISLDNLELVTSGAPNWWIDGNNLFYSSIPGAKFPDKFISKGNDSYDLPKNTLFISHIDPIPSCLLWGHDCVIYLGKRLRLPTSGIVCANGAHVAIFDDVRATNNLRIDARNNGFVYLLGDCLIGPDVRIDTDDKHAILDAATKLRVNQRGGTVIVNKHVWLARGVSLMGGANIGSHSVIGASSIVKKTVPEGCVVVGAPGKIVRKGITWTEDDVI